MVLSMRYSVTIATHCKNRPALYPMPIPVDDICVERRNSMDVTFFSTGIGRLALGEAGRRTVVASASTSGVPRVSSGGSSDMIVDCRSGVVSGL